MLLNKMNEISSKPSTIDNHNPNQYKRSLNKELRQREADKINAENYVCRSYSRTINGSNCTGIREAHDYQPTAVQEKWLVCIFLIHAFSSPGTHQNKLHAPPTRTSHAYMHLS